MNLMPLRTVFFEKRIPQNLPFVKTWQDMENAKPLPQSLKTDPNPAGGAQKKAAKTRRTSCGKAENMPYPDLKKSCPIFVGQDNRMDACYFNSFFIHLRASLRWFHP